MMMVLMMMLLMMMMMLVMMIVVMMMLTSVLILMLMMMMIISINATSTLLYSLMPAWITSAPTHLWMSKEENLTNCYQRPLHHALQLPQVALHALQLPQVALHDELVLAWALLHHACHLASQHL